MAERAAHGTGGTGLRRLQASMAERGEHPRRADSDRADLRGARRAAHGPELPVRQQGPVRLHLQRAASEDHHPAGGDHRDHRARGDPGDHLRRNRSLLRLDRGGDRDDRHELRRRVELVNGNPNPKAIFGPRPDGSAGDRPAGRGPRLRGRGGPGQRRSDRVHADPAVHRDARHDGHRARRRKVVVEREPGLVPDRGLCLDWLRDDAGGVVRAARDPVPPRPEVHRLRQAHLCDRLERGRGADERHQGRPPQGARLHDRRDPRGLRRDRRERKEPDRPGGHGDHVRARRHRDGGHRRRVALGRAWLDHRDGAGGPHLRGDHLGLHLPAARRLLPGDGEGRDHRRRGWCSTSGGSGARRRGPEEHRNERDDAPEREPGHERHHHRDPGPHQALRRRPCARGRGFHPAQRRARRHRGATTARGNPPSCARSPAWSSAPAAPSCSTARK